jgi:SAM-dependent methyltransferase
MSPARNNRFDDFFAEESYVSLKNLFYNYLLRRRAVAKCMQDLPGQRILDVGSGLSPMVGDSDLADRVVHCDLSFRALRRLKQERRRGFFVAADAVRLPFRDASFSRIVCAEVLEHIPEDRRAIREMASALKTGGSLILTFPHRRAWYGLDDRFVHHLRRYDLGEMLEGLTQAGLDPAEIRKVLGPLEKGTMVAAVWLLILLQSFQRGKGGGESRKTRKMALFLFKWCNRFYCLPAWLDARISPRRLAHPSGEAGS